MCWRGDVWARYPGEWEDLQLGRCHEQLWDNGSQNGLKVKKKLCCRIEKGSRGWAWINFWSTTHNYKEASTHAWIITLICNMARKGDSFAVDGVFEFASFQEKILLVVSWYDAHCWKFAFYYSRFPHTNKMYFSSKRRGYMHTVVLGSIIPPESFRNPWMPHSKHSEIRQVCQNGRKSRPKSLQGPFKNMQTCPIPLRLCPLHLQPPPIPARGIQDRGRLTRYHSQHHFQKGRCQ